MKIELALIKEEQQYLVAGVSAMTGKLVFGFPYYHKKNSEDGVTKACPCIILPCADDGKVLSKEEGEKYDFVVLHGEFHPIQGKLYRFLREENDAYYFENDIKFEL